MHRFLVIWACLGCMTLRAEPRFDISFPRSIRAEPLDGRVLLVLSKDFSREPRFTVSPTVNSQQIFGIDVARLQPGRSATIDGSVLGFPLDRLRDLPSGDYNVQALVNIYETFHLGDGRVLKLPPDRGEGQNWSAKPGNLYSRPVKFHLEPDGPQRLTLSLTEVIPPIDGRQPENKWVKYEKIPSALLTKFWGRPIELGAIVILPDGWAEHPAARYPLIIEENHYSLDPCFRTQSPDSAGAGEDKGALAEFHKFYEDWTQNRLPRVILATFQHPTPYYDDSYSVNSANTGPYGDAITQEMIPYLEKKYHGLGQGWARAVYGISTGGWEALASQIFHPDFYNGAWVFCPDPVDFRAYMTMNLYADANAYYEQGPMARIARPCLRETDGLPYSTMPLYNRYEEVIASHGRSGDMFDNWQALYSPAGRDGYPAPIFDKQTGAIDPRVAAYWKEHYDLSDIVRRNWATLGPKLTGKLHFYVGDADTYYLDRAVHLFQDATASLAQPPLEATFDYGQREPHGYTGRYDHSIGLRSYYLPRIVQHMLDTAPAGADVTSWRY